MGPSNILKIDTLDENPAGGWHEVKLLSNQQS